MPDADGLIVARGERVYAVLNLYPYNPGHLMVVPYRHLPDYTDLDARTEVSRVGDVPARLQRLVGLAADAASRGGPVVLGGSSLGAYVSAIASLQVPTRALFLMVPPLGMGPMPALDAAPVPLSVVHAWHDELIPAAGVIEWARARSARLLLLDDSHRLSAHVDATARAFAELLESLPA